MIRLKLRVLGRKTTEVKGQFHHIISKVHTIHILPTVNVTLDHLAEVLFVRVLHSKVTLLPTPPPLPLTYSLERSHYAQPTLKEWVLFSPFLRVECLHKLFGCTLHGRSISSSPFINLLGFFFLDQYGLTGIYNPYFGLQSSTTFYFVGQIVPALMTRSYFSWLLCLFDILPPIIATVA